jgi:hypothetical protein
LLEVKVSEAKHGLNLLAAAARSLVHEYGLDEVADFREQ